MKQTFYAYIKNFIKQNKYVTLDSLEFMREEYNRVNNCSRKSATMERELRKIVERSNRTDEDGNYIHEKLFGYRIVKVTNEKNQIIGYKVMESLDTLPKEKFEDYRQDAKSIIKNELSLFDFS